MFSYDAKLVILGYIDLPSYPGRFANSTFLDISIIFDTLTGLVNATHFCKQYEEKGFCDKKFHIYMRYTSHKDMIIADYKKLPSDPNSTSVYSQQFKMYALKGRRKNAVLCGTYVHYHSIVDIALWCDEDTPIGIFQLLPELNKYLQLYKRQTQTKNSINYQRQTYTIDTSLTTIGKLFNVIGSDKNISMTILDLFKVLYPWMDAARCVVIDNVSFRYGTILVLVEYKEQEIITTHDVYLTIIISFVGESRLDFYGKLVVININNLSMSITLIANLLVRYEDMPLEEGDAQTTWNELRDIVERLNPAKYKQHLISQRHQGLAYVHQEPVKQNQELVERHRELVEHLGFDIDMAKTADNIEKLKNTHLRKKRYQQIYADGKLNLLPPALIAFVPKT